MASVATLVKLCGIKREARKSAKKLRHVPRGHAARLAMARELRDWRAKYEKARFQVTGVRRDRCAI